VEPEERDNDLISNWVDDAIPTKYCPAIGLDAVELAQDLIK
jgi:hypothetical protein